MIEAYPTHVAYADESSHNVGRYRAIALVGMHRDVASPLKTELRRLLADSGVREAKWQNVKTARNRFAAEKLLRAFLAGANRGELRADVMIWDTYDARHSVPGRDDSGNLARMYYHLCRCTFRDRAPRGAVWAVFPDEQSEMDWTVLRQTLGLEGFKEGLRRGGRLIEAHHSGYRIASVNAVRSHEEPIVQIADLLAGMAVYSYASFGSWEAWQHEHGPAPRLFDDGSALALSNGDRERCRLLGILNSHCKAQKWGVALRSTQGLATRDPARGPINFWLYTPQHESDRAPVREGRLGDADRP
jgi:hypothetical protein